MPLSVVTLTEALRTFLDKDFEGFTGFPTNEADAAAKWAAAVDLYTGGGANLVPPSLSGIAAKAAMQAAMSGMSLPGAGPVVFEGAFAAYATALIPGMLPAFVGFPPPPTLAAAMLANAALTLPPNPPKPTAVQVAATAAVIDLWFRTGTASPSGNPPLAPWA